MTKLPAFLLAVAMLSGCTIQTSGLFARRAPEAAQPKPQAAPREPSAPRTERVLVAERETSRRRDTRSDAAPPAPTPAPSASELTLEAWKAAQAAGDDATIAKVCDGSMHVLSRAMESQRGRDMVARTGRGQYDDSTQRAACLWQERKAELVTTSCDNLAATFKQVHERDLKQNDLRPVNALAWGQKFVACKKSVELFEVFRGPHNIIGRYRGVMAELAEAGAPVDALFVGYLKKAQGRASLDFSEITEYYQDTGAFPHCGLLSTALRGTNIDVHRRAMGLLVIGKCPGAAKIAVELLDNAEKPATSVYYCNALAKVGTPRELGKLRSVSAGTNDYDVRKACKRAITEIEKRR